MKKGILLMVGLMALFTVTGCGTVKGIGDDISAVGSWLSKGSVNVQENVGKKK